MRLLLIPAVLASLLATATADDKKSNPALLGIGMNDLQVGPQTVQRTWVGGTCVVTNVIRGSGAKAAGMRAGDVLQTIDGASVADCNAVLRTVQARQPGDVVDVKVERGGSIVTLRASLLTRDEILRRRLVGAPVGATELYAVDEDHKVDLAANRGKTTVVGWFDARCTRCAEVFAKVADWTRKQADKAGATPVALAVTSAIDASKSARTPLFRSLASTLDVPVAVADPIVFEEFTSASDADGVQFTVIDCRGVVQYVAPVTSTGDDSDAALDEVFAAAEQAARQAIKR